MTHRDTLWVIIIAPWYKPQEAADGVAPAPPDAAV
jgi:hypothetical protein